MQYIRTFINPKNEINFVVVFTLSQLLQLRKGIKETIKAEKKRQQQQQQYK